MLRYALYARKSKEDKSGIIKSIQDQIDVWQSLGQERGLTIARVYEENKTAKIPGVRSVYNQMVADIRAGQIDGILVWHINRLARNMEEAGSLAQMLIDKKIQEIQTPHWTYRPTDNILPLLLEQGTSTQYSLDLSSTVTRGIRSMVEAGGWPHQAKVGYLNRRDPLNPKKGVIVKDPERFDLLRRAFDLALTGAYSIRRVTDTLNDEWGFSTRPTPSRPGGPLSYAAAYDIFTNAFYAGFTTHNGVQRRGVHPVMITVQEYNRLQATKKRGLVSRQRKREFTYTGLIRCGLCGMNVTAEYHYKSGKDRIYYHCSDPYLKCTKKGLSEEKLEAQIIAKLENLTLDPELCEAALENIARWQAADTVGTEEVQMQQHKALADIAAQRENLLTMMLKGLLTDEAMYKEKEARLLEQHNALQRHIRQTQQDKEHVQANAHAAANYLQKAQERFLVGSSARKKEIARALSEEYVLSGNELCIRINPLLEEFVRYAKRIKTKLEPPSSGSGSGYSTSVTTMCCVGRDTEYVIEPEANLIAALKDSILSDIFALPS